MILICHFNSDDFQEIKYIHYFHTTFYTKSHTILNTLTISFYLFLFGDQENWFV